MKSRKTLQAIIGATAATALITLTGSQEGLRNTPYRDTGGKWTVCRGQTGIPMHYYTDAQCDAILAATLAGFAEQVQTRITSFDALKQGQKIAIIDLTYNVGVGAALGTSGNPTNIARRYSAGDFPAACDDFLNYRLVRGVGKVATAYSRRASQGSISYMDCSERANNCYGVWQRRLDEQKVCING